MERNRLKEEVKEVAHIWLHCTLYSANGVRYTLKSIHTLHDVYCIQYTVHEEGDGETWEEETKKPL